MIANKLPIWWRISLGIAVGMLVFAVVGRLWMGSVVDAILEQVVLPIVRLLLQLLQ